MECILALGISRDWRIINLIFSLFWNPYRERNVAVISSPLSTNSDLMETFIKKADVHRIAPIRLTDVV